MAKTRAQAKDEIRVELAQYVLFRRKVGEPLTFQKALSGHRQVCVENAERDPEGYWSERVSLLDDVAMDEGFVP